MRSTRLCRRPARSTDPGLSPEPFSGEGRYGGLDVGLAYRPAHEIGVGPGKVDPAHGPAERGERSPLVIPTTAGGALRSASSTAVTSASSSSRGTTC